MIGLTLINCRCSNTHKQSLFDRQSSILNEMKNITDSLNRSTDYNKPEPYNYQKRARALESELDSIHAELKKL